MNGASRRYLRILSATSLAGASWVTTVSASGASARSHAVGPVRIGISLSLSGAFSAGGRALQQGYQLWQTDINRTGGLLGRRVVLDIKSDASRPTQVVANYRDLIANDHVALTFGPFSSLLSLRAAQAVSAYGYALVEGAGGSPSVFRARLHNLFDVSLPVADALMPFATWVTSLPPAQRPKTVAFVTSNNPGTEPQVTTIEPVLRHAHVRVVYRHVFSARATNYASLAHAVAASRPQVVVLGSLNVPTVSAFVRAFERLRFSPKVFIATGGPNQAAAFLKSVGPKNANGVMVPNAWYAGSANSLSSTMVSQYVKRYGGTAFQVSSGVAEAFAVGQVVAQAVLATGGFNNQKIIAFLHSGVTLQSVQGSVNFNALGQNTEPTAFTFQWQGAKLVQVNPVGDPNSVKVLYPKPAWGK